MELFCWILAAFLAYGALATLAVVGKPRRPLTGGMASYIVFITACEVTGLALIATGVLR
jgi:hypothetical protein